MVFGFVVARYHTMCVVAVTPPLPFSLFYIWNHPYCLAFALSLCQILHCLFGHCGYTLYFAHDDKPLTTVLWHTPEHGLSTSVTIVSGAPHNIPAACVLRPRRTVTFSPFPHYTNITPHTYVHAALLLIPALNCLVVLLLPCFVSMMSLSNPCFSWIYLMLTSVNFVCLTSE